MGISYIPGPESILAPAGQQLVQGLAQFLRPDQQFQRAMQGLLGRDPALMQNLADVESQAPGTLAQMGFGNLAGIIGKIPPTSQAVYTARNRQQIVSGMEAAQGAETAKNLYSTDQVNAALDLIKKDPTIKMDAALKLTTGQTAAERAVSQTEAKKAGAVSTALDDPNTAAVAGAVGATGMTPSQAAAEPFKVRAQQNAVRMLQEGVPITMQRFLNNEYSTDDLASIFSTPLGSALKEQLDYYSAQLRAQIATGNSNDAMERLKMTKAYDLLTKVRGGTFKSAYDYLYDPAAHARAVELVKNPRMIKTDEDKALVATHTQFGTFDDDQRRASLSGLTKDLVSLRAAFQSSLNKGRGGLPGKKGDDQRELLVAQMNEILSQRALFGAPRYTATYEEVARPFAVDVKELVFKDEQGKIVPPGMVDVPMLNREVPVSAPANAAPADTARPPMDSAATAKAVDAAVAHYKALGTPGEKAAQLARWRSEIKDSTILKQLEEKVKQ